MSAENRRILIIDDERPILLTLGSVARPSRLSAGNGRHRGLRFAASKEQNSRGRSARSAIAGRGRLGNARSDQARASGNPGDHSDGARFTEQRHRVDQARRLSLHQQTVRAGGVAQSDRESARKTIAPSRNGRAAGENAATGEAARNRGDASWRPSSRARRCRRSRS